MSDLDAELRARLGPDDIRTSVWNVHERGALVAVVARHKPHPGLYGPYCEVCVGGYEGVSEWPCETVRDIAKALGLEVGRD